MPNLQHQLYCQDEADHCCGGIHRHSVVARHLCRTGSDRQHAPRRALVCRAAIFQRDFWFRNRASGSKPTLGAKPTRVSKHRWGLWQFPQHFPGAQVEPRAVPGTRDHVPVAFSLVERAYPVAAGVGYREL